MTVSWFGSNSNAGFDDDGMGHASKISMKAAAQALYPQKRSMVAATGHSRSTRSRFSTLLLEHGEKHIQDWAVIAYSNPLDKATLLLHSGASPRKPHLTTTWAASSPPASTNKKAKKRGKKAAAATTKESHPTVYMMKWEGRLHLCSKSLVLEPNDSSRGIVRIPFSRMPGPPKEYPRSDSSLTETGSFDPTCVELESSRHFVMKENHSIGPYHPMAVPTTFRFTFLHSKPSILVDLCHKLFPLLSSKQPNDLERLLQPMYDRPFDYSNLHDVRERPLTTGGAVKCQWMQPLQSHPGCVVVTQERLYFQPAAGVVGLEFATSQCTSWNFHSQLIATARRYKGLEDAALELYWKDGTSTLFAFERKHEREQVLRLLPSFLPCHTDREFLLQAHKAWQAESITNYEYLLILNSAAGRSFQDLSRYPVVPWVIADYESAKLDLNNPATFRDLTKPVGALNPKRLDYFQQRYESMHDAMEDRFLYGTHYSAAGYVLYYLVRSMPEHMLCLQNGKFDAPDRMFHSLSHCYNCAMTNHADVKELIPEFYSPNLDYDFLINARGLQLGATQNGDRVNDVSLPPWAKSARDFLKKNAKALESEICTSMLPRWIDLIFGSKSRGDPAMEAANLFHHFAYMGPADLANLPTQEERFQAELHATEFGLVPDQLFVGPHPMRHETVDESFVNPDVGRTFSGTDDAGKGEAWELLEPPANTITEEDREGESGTPAEFGSEPALASHESGETEDNPLNRYDSEDAFLVVQNNRSDQPQGSQGQRERPSIPLSGTGDSADRQTSGAGGFSYLSKEPTLSNVSSASGLVTNPSFKSADVVPPAKPVAQSAEWDIKFFEKRQIHEDAISGCALIPHGGPNNTSLLVTTSLDGGLKVHTVSLSGTDASQASDTAASSQYQGLTSTLSRFSYLAMSRGQTTTTDQSKLTEYRSHASRDPLACLTMGGDGHGGKITFAGGHDDVVLAYGINSACAVASVYSHRDAVTGLDLLVRPPLLASTALWLKKSTHIMVSGSWDATVKAWSVTVANGETVSINREPLAELFDADSSVVCVSAASVPDVGGIVVAAGCADGSFCVWNLHSDGVKVVIHKEPARRGSGPCSSVQWSTGPGERLHLFTGFSTGKVASFSLVDGDLHKASAASVGVAVQCLSFSENILLIGCADGGLRLIPIRDGAYFGADLSLWGAVNGKSSPGISSLGMSFIGNGSDGSGKCMCCTGAEDGSIAVFELKRVSSS